MAKQKQKQKQQKGIQSVSICPITENVIGSKACTRGSKNNAKCRGCSNRK